MKNEDNEGLKKPEYMRNITPIEMKVVGSHGIHYWIMLHNPYLYDDLRMTWPKPLARNAPTLARLGWWRVVSHTKCRLEMARISSVLVWMDLKFRIIWLTWIRMWFPEGILSLFSEVSFRSGTNVIFFQDVKQVVSVAALCNRWLPFLDVGTTTEKK